MDKDKKEEKCSSLVAGSSRSEFYENAIKYWNEIPISIDGMLGGFGYISKTDIMGSQIFLRKIFEMKDPPRSWRALDCGAGIGRVSRSLLVHYYYCVDLVEQNPKFVEASTLYMSNHIVFNYFNTGLQDFTPQPNLYDLIWCQWVLGHLLDDDLVEFFKRCIPGLRARGVIVVKENVTSSGKTELDTNDSSVTRSLSNLTEIFDKADLQCVRKECQYTFPRGLYPVYMFALKPKSPIVQEQRK